MKQTSLAIILILVLASAGGGYWVGLHRAAGSAAGPVADKPAEPPEMETHVSHDENGNVVVNISDDTQGDIGLSVTQPEASQWSPEVKGYGQVMDPAPLAALLTELATAQAAWPASSNELARLQTLAAQGNASTRALQAAEAAAAHDLLAIQSARARLVLGWGAAVADRNDLPGFVQSLASLNSALIRIDLPAGEGLPAPPEGARIVTLAGTSVTAEFLGPVANVDPQTQGCGFVFLLNQNAARLLPGEAVTGWLKTPGAPLTGVVIPRDAIVRTQGGGWVYVLNAGGEGYTRIRITLDRPTETGWFVDKGVATADHIVTTGAQTLLSEELKASLSGG